MSKMMNSKCLVWLGLVLFCFAGVAMAETFTWTDDGADMLWSTCGNWTSLVQDPDPCYPSETTADVLIDGDPLENETVLLQADSETVDDITIRGTFTIDNNRSNVSRLKMDSLRIIGGSSGAKLTITNDSRLEGLG